MNAFHRLYAPLLFVTLSGCAFGDSSIQQNYVLPVPTIAAYQSVKPLHIQVLPVEVAAGLDTSHIALIENDVRMDYLADSKWAESLPEMLQSVLIETLRQSHLATSVSSEAAGANADRLIHLTASSFNAVRNAEGGIAVRVSLEAKVISPQTHDVLSVEDVWVEQNASSAEMGSVMRTFNTANAEAMHQLIEKLSIGLKNESEAKPTHTR